MTPVQSLMRPTSDTVALTDSVQEAGKRLVGGHGRSLGVIDASGCFAGVVTEQDIITACVATGTDP
jgi:CBS domain-containing protein